MNRRRFLHEGPMIRRAAAAAAGAVLLLAAAAAIAAGAIVSVRMNDRVEIDADQILLGRVARIDGGDGPLASELAAVPLGRSPLPGKSRTLEGPFIEMRLRQSGIDPASLDLQIPAEVVVTRGAIEIRAAEIEEAVRQFILRQFAGRPEAVKIREIRNVEPVLLPRGKVSLEVTAPRNATLAGSVPLQVAVKAGEDFEKRIWVTAVLETRVEAVVAKRPLGRYKPLDEDDIEVRPVDLGDLPSDYLSDPGMVVGKRTRRALDSGTVMRPDLLESPPIVKRGDRVVIVAETGGLRVTTLGQVKQKGALGETIPIVNLDSNRIVYGRVVDARTVRVDF
jgi:flagella basal body P-ring formation protein FlgA